MKKINWIILLALLTGCTPKTDVREPLLIETSSGTPPELLLLFFVILICIGIFIWLVWVFFKRAQATDTESVLETAPHPSARASSSTASLISVNHLASGEWEICINGERYRSLEAVPQATVRREVVAGVRELVAFARSSVPANPSAAAPSTVAVPAPAAVAPAIVPAAVVGAPTLAVPPAGVAGEQPATPGNRPRVTLPQGPKLVRPDAPPVWMPTIDLAKEIGEIVEEMQERSPTLQKRSIRLRNAAGGGVEFAIDGIVYADVTEIPETEIQDLIRRATKEWERR